MPRPSARQPAAQQCRSVLHRTRESLVRDRVNVINQIHGFLLEFGIGMPIGKGTIRRLPSVLTEHPLAARLVRVIERLHAHIKYLDEQIDDIERSWAGSCSTYVVLRLLILDDVNGTPA